MRLSHTTYTSGSDIPLNCATHLQRLFNYKLVRSLYLSYSSDLNQNWINMSSFDFCPLIISKKLRQLFWGGCYNYSLKTYLPQRKSRCFGVHCKKKKYMVYFSCSLLSLFINGKQKSCTINRVHY